MTLSHQNHLSSPNRIKLELPQGEAHAASLTENDADPFWEITLHGQGPAIRGLIDSEELLSAAPARFHSEIRSLLDPATETDAAYKILRSLEPELQASPAWLPQILEYIVMKSENVGCRLASIYMLGALGAEGKNSSAVLEHVALNPAESQYLRGQSLVSLGRILQSDCFPYCRVVLEDWVRQPDTVISRALQTFDTFVERGAFREEKLALLPSLLELHTYIRSRPPSDDSESIKRLLIKILPECAGDSLEAKSRVEFVLKQTILEKPEGLATKELAIIGLCRVSGRNALPFLHSQCRPDVDHASHASFSIFNLITQEPFWRRLYLVPLYFRSYSQGRRLALAH